MNSGRFNRAQTLINFSESPENKANVSNAVENGVVFIAETSSASPPQPQPQSQPKPQPSSVSATVIGAIGRRLVEGGFIGSPDAIVRVNGEFACLSRNKFYINSFDVTRVDLALKIEVTDSGSTTNMSASAEPATSHTGLTVSEGECLKGTI